MIMAKKSKKDKRQIFLVFVFIMGFLIASYPLVSNYYYGIVHTNEINTFIDGANALSMEELNEKIELAGNYNSVLDPTRLSDPYTEEEKAGIAEYARMLEVHEKIGFLEIPKIDVNLPVYAGTSDYVLEKGVGHLEGTSLPIGGESTHSVVTAHRGLPRAKLFRNLNELEVGDIFYFHNIESILAYEVDQVLVVEPWDFEPVLVVEGEDLMTLLTCTPYMINSHRLLVRGTRVDYTPPVQEETLTILGPDFKYKDYLPFVAAILLLLLVLTIYFYRDYRKAKRKAESIYNEENK